MTPRAATGIVLKIRRQPGFGRTAAGAALVTLLAALFIRPMAEMANSWSLAGSYYTHGYLIPPVCAYLVWNKRGELARLRAEPDAAGYVLVAVAGLMLWSGAFLGFRVLEQAALLPMLFGVVLTVFGRGHVKALWFPLLFPIFMMPIPSSLTQTLAFRIKIIAVEGAVLLANLVSLPMLRQGSYIHFKHDRILVGEVCGGLRSLIALLALGALVAHLSSARPWARFALFLSSAPVAICANIIRIFLLCVVAHLFGGARAGGMLHDVSGVMIFVVAFALFLGLETLLRRLAPEDGKTAT